ncbi:MAG: site-specific integrase [Acidobacteria bacterium]|nr:site-specific integrase [Acidobacteriota bacterium]
MITEFFESPFRILQLRSGQDGELLDVFAQQLRQSGFAKITARRHLRAAEHLLYWAKRKGVSPATFDEGTLEEFALHLHRCRCKNFGQTQQRDLQKGARWFLESLRRVGLLPRPTQEAVEEPQVLLLFRDWMRRHRGTCDATLSNYCRPVRLLLRTLGDDPSKFEAQSLRQFVQETCQRSGCATGKLCTTALRAFLRFLIADSKCAAGLDACIPSLAHWRLSSLPRYLQPEEVERVIASCSATSAAGIRDRAILLLIARVGLRAGDILRLCINDLDWKEATIRVVGKGRRQTLLPMTQEVGNAIVGYLKNARRPIGNDTLFIRSRAPFGPFASHCAISVIVAQAMRRAGVRCPSRGAAHVLRHSVASSMLRQGASLQEIAGVLRHRSVATTEIYAKVDVVALREIAQPWPRVISC